MSRTEARRWLVTAPGETLLELFASPEPGPDQLAYRTEVSLVSAGTELAILTGIHQGLANPNAPWPKFPVRMGYMSVIRVIEVGPGVTRFRPGDRLLASTGHGSHGVLDVPEDRPPTAWTVPEGIPAERLVLARMGKTAVTAACQAGVTLAQSIAVVGLGIVGQVALRCFRAAGAWPIVGIDPVLLRRSVAREGGADACIDPAAEEPAAVVRRLVPGGADIVVDATGWAEALPGTLSCARDAGTVVILGSPRGRAQEVDFYSDLHRRSLRVVGAHDSAIGAQVRPGFPWTNDRVVPSLVAWIGDGRLPLDGLVTHHVRPERLPEMYDLLLHRKEEVLGVVLDWREEFEPARSQSAGSDR